MDIWLTLIDFCQNIKLLICGNFKNPKLRPRKDFNLSHVWSTIGYHQVGARLYTHLRVVQSSQGVKWGTHQLVYVPEGLDWLIHSKEACQALGIRPHFSIWTHGHCPQVI